MVSSILSLAVRALFAVTVGLYYYILIRSKDYAEETPGMPLCGS